MLTIRDLLGHSSVTMTDRYMHGDQADIHDAVRKLEKFRSHSGHSAIAFFIDRISESSQQIQLTCPR